MQQLPLNLRIFFLSSLQSQNFVGFFTDLPNFNPTSFLDFKTSRSNVPIIDQPTTHLSVYLYKTVPRWQCRSIVQKAPRQNHKTLFEKLSEKT